MNARGYKGVAMLAAVMTIALLPVTASSDLPLTRPPVEMQAPDMRLPRLDGTTFDLKERAGKVTVLNFWALWCAPCKTEMPALAALQRELAPAGIDVIAVNLGDSIERVRAFAEDFGLGGLPIVIDDVGAAKAWHVGALPVTYVVGPTGRIVYAALGAREWQDTAIAAALRSLQTAD